jgi:late embryogenesis abundant protein
MAPRLIWSTFAALIFCGCTALDELRAFVQPPRFEQAPNRDAEIRLRGPGAGLPLGGAVVRLWTKVSNPNAFGVTLGTLNGSLYLEERRAADADFPLGLPLGAGGETTIPIDLSISFSDLPGLADVVRRAASREPLAYRLEGTIGVDAGRLGTPVFGPMTLLSGDVRVR